MNVDCVAPRVDETSDSEEKTPKDKLLYILDKVEALVESLRKEALTLEERKDSLFTTLDAVRNSDMLQELSATDRDDIQRYVDRISQRCATIEMLVRTDRDASQEDALFEVNHLIDALVTDFKTDPGSARTKCQIYLSSCTSQSEAPVDKQFESALLGCALDDQKKIKKRLQGLFRYLEQDGKIIPMPED